MSGPSKQHISILKTPSILSRVHFFLRKSRNEQVGVKENLHDFQRQLCTGRCKTSERQRSPYYWAETRAPHMKSKAKLAMIRAMMACRISQIIFGASTLNVNK